VGFHPTRIGNFSDTLTITSPQLPLGMPLQVSRRREPDAHRARLRRRIRIGSSDSTSFYGCSCSGTAGDPRSALPIVLALGLVIVRRRT